MSTYVCGLRAISSLPALMRASHNSASRSGFRSPLRMAAWFGDHATIACPLSPLISLMILAGWMFIFVSAFCIC
jgi:hypothetical protein